MIIYYHCTRFLYVYNCCSRNDKYLKIICLSHHQKIEHDDQLLSSRNAPGMVKVVDQLACGLL